MSSFSVVLLKAASWVNLLGMQSMVPLPGREAFVNRISELLNLLPYMTIALVPPGERRVLLDAIQKADIEPPTCGRSITLCRFALAYILNLWRGYLIYAGLLLWSLITHR